MTSKNLARRLERLLPATPAMSRAMLLRCSHVRLEAKCRALGGIATRQLAADEKRHREILQSQAVVVCANPSAVVQ
jgi:hypothetical protein